MRNGMWFILGAGLASALAGAGTLRGRYRQDMKAIEDRLAAESQTAPSDAGPVEYGRWGCGRPALVIHGAGGGLDQGLALGSEILGEGFNIIAPSRFGYLNSPVLADGSPSAQAEAHAAVLVALGIPRAIVMGVSAGAPSAIEFALKYPERTEALVLLVPRAYAPDAAPIHAPVESKRILAAVEQGSDFAFWCAMRVARRAIVRFLGVPPELEAAAPPDEQARVTAIITGLLPLSRRVAGIRNDGAIEIGPWQLEKIVAPTLVVTARDDLYGTLPAARYTAERIKGASLVEFASGGHLMVGRTAELREQVARFLAQAATPEKAAA
jgi:2-hydroxy-6-oxonona-2,4-dienedioate hydrolase